MRFLSHVSTLLVIRERRPSYERFFTLVTPVRFLPRVGAAVDLEAAQPSEHLGAQVTGKRFLPGVNLLVTSQRTGSAERRTALLTAVRPPPSMSVLVGL